MFPLYFALLISFFIAAIIVRRMSRDTSQDLTYWDAHFKFDWLRPWSRFVHCNTEDLLCRIGAVAIKFFIIAYPQLSSQVIFIHACHTHTAHAIASTCMLACSFAHSDTHLHARTHARKHMYARTHAHTYTHTRTHTCMHTCTHAYTCASTCGHAHAHARTYMRIQGVCRILLQHT